MPEILHLLWHAVEHTVLDTLKVLPFLFLTYLLMEFLEHKAGGAAERWLKGSGKIGPLLGGALGILPQHQRTDRGNGHEEILVKNLAVDNVPCSLP